MEIEQINKLVDQEANSTRQRQYKQRRLDAGLRKYPVWIPDDDQARERVRKYAEKLRKEYKIDID